MRMILALSATDMHRSGLLRSPGRLTAEDHARHHYSLAVREFRQSLETRDGPISQAELEIIFATMFLMVSFEWQWGESVNALQLHLRGVRSLLESHPVLFEGQVDQVLMTLDAPETRTPRASFVPEQLLLWILYALSTSSTLHTDRSDTLTLPASQWVQPSLSTSTSLIQETPAFIQTISTAAHACGVGASGVRSTLTEKYPMTSRTIAL